LDERFELGFHACQIIDLLLNCADFRGCRLANLVTVRAVDRLERDQLANLLECEAQLLRAPNET
jgi:hypothetical protein